MSVSKDILQKLYIEKELTAREIGQILGVERHTIEICSAEADDIAKKLVQFEGAIA